MRIIRARLELRMILNSYVKIAVAQLNCLDEPAVGRESRKRKSSLRKLLAVFVVEFIAVAVAFADFGLAVCAEHGRVFADYAGVRAESQRAALVNSLVFYNSQ